MTLHSRPIRVVVGQTYLAFIQRQVNCVVEGGAKRDGGVGGVRKEWWSYGGHVVVRRKKLWGSRRGRQRVLEYWEEWSVGVLLEKVSCCDVE